MAECPFRFPLKSALINAGPGVPSGAECIRAKCQLWIHEADMSGRVMQTGNCALVFSVIGLMRGVAASEELVTIGRQAFHPTEALQKQPS